MDYKRYFNQRTEKIAQDLLGRLIVRELPSGLLVGQIVETGAYKGGIKKDERIVEARAGMLYDSGKVFLMPHRGNLLFNISTEDEGACVELRRLNVNGKNIEGSGTITNFLQARELDNTILGRNGLNILDFKPKSIGKVKITHGEADNCLSYYFLT